jgi:hypothetical protein
LLGPGREATKIARPSALEDDMSKAMATTDHDEIKRWVEERGGSPARVKPTGRTGPTDPAGRTANGRRRGGDAGLLRIDYPGFSGQEALEEISWQAWFDTFDRHELALLHQDAIAGGKTSRFSKLVSRDTVMPKARGASGGRSAGASARGARAASGRKGAKARSKAGAKRSSAKKKAAAGATVARVPSTRRTASKSRSKAGKATPKARARGARSTTKISRTSKSKRAEARS